MANRKLRLGIWWRFFVIGTVHWCTSAGYRDYSSYFQNAEKFLFKEMNWTVLCENKLTQKKEKKIVLSKSSLKLNKLSKINNTWSVIFLRFSVFFEKYVVYNSCNFFLVHTILCFIFYFIYIYIYRNYCTF